MFARGDVAFAIHGGRGARAVTRRLRAAELDVMKVKGGFRARNAGAAR